MTGTRKGAKSTREEGTQDHPKASDSTRLFPVGNERFASAGYYAMGEFTRESLVLFAAAFPAMLIGIYIGNRIHLNISEVAFRRLVIIVLFACAVPLMLR